MSSDFDRPTASRLPGPYPGSSQMRNFVDQSDHELQLEFRIREDLLLEQQEKIATLVAQVETLEAEAAKLRWIIRMQRYLEQTLHSHYMAALRMNSGSGAFPPNMMATDSKNVSLQSLPSTSPSPTHLTSPRHSPSPSSSSTPSPAAAAASSSQQPLALNPSASSSSSSSMLASLNNSSSSSSSLTSPLGHFPSPSPSSSASSASAASLASELAVRGSKGPPAAIPTQHLLLHTHLQHHQQQQQQQHQQQQLHLQQQQQQQQLQQQHSLMLSEATSPRDAEQHPYSFINYAFPSSSPTSFHPPSASPGSQMRSASPTAPRSKSPGLFSHLQSNPNSYPNRKIAPGAPKVGGMLTHPPSSSPTSSSDQMAAFAHLPRPDSLPSELRFHAALLSSAAWDPSKLTSTSSSNSAAQLPQPIQRTLSPLLNTSGKREIDLISSSSMRHPIRVPSPAESFEPLEKRPRTLDQFDGRLSSDHWGSILPPSPSPWPGLSSDSPWSHGPHHSPWSGRSDSPWTNLGLPNKYDTTRRTGQTPVRSHINLSDLLRMNPTMTFDFTDQNTNSWPPMAMGKDFLPVPVSRDPRSTATSPTLEHQHSAIENGQILSELPNDSSSLNLDAHPSGDPPKFSPVSFTQKSTTGSSMKVHSPVPIKVSQSPQPQ